MGLPRCTFLNAVAPTPLSPLSGFLLSPPVFTSLKYYEQDLTGCAGNPPGPPTTHCLINDQKSFSGEILSSHRAGVEDYFFFAFLINESGKLFAEASSQRCALLTGPLESCPTCSGGQGSGAGVTRGHRDLGFSLPASFLDPSSYASSLLPPPSQHPPPSPHRFSRDTPCQKPTPSALRSGCRPKARAHHLCPLPAYPPRAAKPTHCTHSQHRPVPLGPSSPTKGSPAAWTPTLKAAPLPLPS